MGSNLLFFLVIIKYAVKHLNQTIKIKKKNKNKKRAYSWQTVETPPMVSSSSNSSCVNLKKK